jgi:Na+/H+ antiporter NhaD/arsenite permease-like protein
MAVLIVVFVWLPYSWNKIAITILGVLLAILALVGTCCCAAMAEAKGKDAGTAEVKQTGTAEAKE